MANIKEAIEVDNPNLIMVRNPKRVSEITVDINEQRIKKLHGAALSVNFPLALELLLKGVDVDSRHPITGRTPLGTLCAHIARCQLQIPEKNETQPWYKQLYLAYEKMTNSENSHSCVSGEPTQNETSSMNEVDSLRLLRLFLTMGANPNQGALHAVAESAADTGKFISTLLRAGADPLKTSGKHSDGRDAFACCGSQASFQKMHGLAAGVNVSRWSAIRVAFIPVVQLSGTLSLAQICGMRIGFTISVLAHLFFMMWMGEEERAPFLVQAVAEPQGRYFLAFTTFSLLHLGMFAFVFLSPSQSLKVNKTYGCLYVGVLTSLALVVYSDAGFYDKKDGEKSKQMLKSDIEQWRQDNKEDISSMNKSKDSLAVRISEIERNGYRICETCLILKEQKVRHCSVCNRCVSGWDHHCFWVGNCVASNNRRSFVVMLIIFLSAGLCQIYMFVVYIAKHCDHPEACVAVSDGFKESCRAAHLGECGVYEHPSILLCHLLALLPITWVGALLGDQLHRVGMDSAQKRISKVSLSIARIVTYVMGYVNGVVYFLITGDDTW